MITDIFSSFDPYISHIYSGYSPLLFWIITSTSIILIYSTLWVSQTPVQKIITMASIIMFEQTKRRFGYNLKGYALIITPLFVILISINIIGLLPYAFRYSRHLVFTLTIGLPLWLALILSRFIYRPTSFAASLLPSGAPDWLNPFLVQIETIRISVRPITLSFRLAANIRAGHIVLALIGIYTATALFISSKTFLILISIQIGYLLFEAGICVIQAYIFCLLLTLYSNDHTI